MVRWGYAELGLGPAVSAIYRPDLYARAARSLGLPLPTVEMKPEGIHNGAWEMPATPASVPMEPDQFLDGACFDPAVSAVSGR